MKQTTNYGFNKPELMDSPPDITVLNPNFDKIDTQLKSLTDKDTELNTAINTVKNDYLPKTGGNITNGLTVKNKTVAVSVNGSVADANGNITIDVGGDVQSVNGVQPDENGNVVLDLGGDVQSVDGVQPDAEGNVALNASTREEIIEGAMRVTDVEVEASVATHEGLQTAVARVEANLDDKLSKRGGEVTGALSVGSTLTIKENDVALSDMANKWGETAIRFFDADGVRVGRLQTYYTSGGNAQLNIRVSNASTEYNLRMTSDGLLQWDNNEVERVMAYGVSNGQIYQRFASGLQIVMGTGSGSGSFDFTFNVPFSATPYAIAGRVSSATNTSSNYHVWCRSITSTALNVYTSGDTAFRWLAIGKWK